MRADRTITCWGSNNHHWDGETYVGQADAPSGHFSAVTAGTWHSCGVRTDGTITCWGLNDQGQANAPSA